MTGTLITIVAAAVLLAAVAFIFAMALKSARKEKEEALALLCAVYASRLTLSLADKPEVLLRLSGKETPLTQCRELLEHYRGFLDTLHPKENKEKEE